MVVSRLRRTRDFVVEYECMGIRVYEEVLWNIQQFVIWQIKEIALR